MRMTLDRAREVAEAPQVDVYELVAALKFVLGERDRMESHELERARVSALDGFGPVVRTF